MPSLAITKKTGHARSRAGRSSGKQTRLQEVCSQLTELAYELGPDAKLPTMLELRDRLSVSVATLTAALSELEAQRVIRRRHGVGIYVASRLRHRRVCLICAPCFFRYAGTSPFWSMLVEQVRIRAQALEEECDYHFTSDSLLDAGIKPGSDPARSTPEELPLQASLAADIQGGRVDGALLVGVAPTVVEWIERQGVPAVAFAGGGRHLVALASAEAVKLSVAELARRGCRRLALWSSTNPYRSLAAPSAAAQDRNLLAFRETLDEYGLDFDPALVELNTHYVGAEGGYHTITHQEQGYRTALKFFGQDTQPDRWPDGIVSTDDMLTLGALSVLQKYEVRPGREIQMVSHANVGSPVLLGWENELILIEVDPVEIVQRMFDLLERLMEGETLEHPVAVVHSRLRCGDRPHLL